MNKRYINIKKHKAKRFLKEYGLIILLLILVIILMGIGTKIDIQHGIY